MNSASKSPGVANVNPKPILDMNYAFAQTAMLMAAVHLHIFTYLANDPLPAATLTDEVFEMCSNRCYSDNSALLASPASSA